MLQGTNKYINVYNSITVYILWCLFSWVFILGLTNAIIMNNNSAFDRLFSQSNATGSTGPAIPGVSRQEVKFFQRLRKEGGGVSCFSEKVDSEREGTFRIRSNGHNNTRTHARITNTKLRHLRANEYCLLYTSDAADE